MEPVISEGTSRIRVCCAPEFGIGAGDRDECVGLAGHVEIDSPSGTSSMGEVSPTFSTVAEMVDWARLRAGEVVVRIRATIYWEGPTELPADAVDLDIGKAEAEFREFLRDPRYFA